MASRFSLFFIYQIIIQLTNLKFRSVSTLPFLNACQSFNFYYILSGRKSTSTLFWIYFAICLLVPLASVAILIGEHGFGPAVIWCWIEHDRPFLRYALFFIPLWICIFIGILFTFLGVRKVWIVERKVVCSNQSISTLSPSQMLKSYQHTRTASKAFLYGLVFVIVWIPGTANRLYEMVYGSSPFVLVLLHCFFTPIQGFLNALVYFFFQQSKKKSKLSSRHTGMNGGLQSKSSTSSSASSSSTRNGDQVEPSSRSSFRRYIDDSDDEE